MASLMDILAGAGNLLDLPGSSLRDLLSGRNPFDQWATPFSDVNRASGRDVLQPFLGANEETGMSGWMDNPMEGFKDIAGFGAEVLLDPLNLVPLGAVGKALRGRKAARSANAAMKAERGGKYAMVNPKVAGRVASEAAPVVSPVADNPMRLLGYTPAPENPMFPGVEIMHHGGRDMSASATKQHPYGSFDLSRLKTGEGNNMFSPGAYKADVSATSEHYRDLAQKDINTKSTQTPMYQLRNVIDDFTDGMSEEVDVNVLRKFFQDEADNPIMAKAGELFDIIDRNDYFGADKNDLFFWEELQDAMSSKKGLEGYLNNPDAISQLSNFTTDRYAGQARLYGFDAPAGTKDRFLKWENPMSEQPQPVRDLLANPSSFFNPEQLQLMEQAKEANARWTQAGDKLKEIEAYSRGPKYMEALRQTQYAQHDYNVLKNKLLDQNIPYDLATGRFKDLNEIDGETAVELLLGAKPSEASLADTVRMREAGIPGVKNLANSTGQSSYNYAIWDQDLLNKMRIRMIDGQRVPINPTTLVEQVQQPIARAADSPLVSTMNPMQLQPEPSPFPAAVAGAVYNALQAFNDRGGIQ
jgi:hypothetical protein